MAHTNIILHQLTELVSRHDFGMIEQRQAEKGHSKTSRWSQFIAIFMAQLLKLNSLRDIEGALKSKSKSLYHVGATVVPRSTLARMNETLNPELFKQVFEMLLGKCRQFAPNSKFKLKGVQQLLLMDATLIKLNLELFPWAAYRQRKGAIKLHVGLDDDGLLPVFCDLTKGKVHEINHARLKSYPVGSLLCFDRGYTDYLWWEQLTNAGVFFVTRLKSNADYTQIRRKRGRRAANVSDDEIIKLKGSEQEYRLVHYTDPETEIRYEFITNAHHLQAKTIADIYKERWQIELFFKWVKQNLKIKTFLGTTENAVLTQIWIALCAYLVVSFLKFQSKTSYSIREILNWIQLNLFSRTFLSDYLVPKITEPIAPRQFSLF